MKCQANNRSRTGNLRAVAFKLGILVIALTLFGCTSQKAEHQPPKTTKPAPADTKGSVNVSPNAEKICQTFRHLHAENEDHGGGILAVNDGTTNLASCTDGVRVDGSPTPIAATDQWETASVAKSVTAAAILQLLDKGLIPSLNVKLKDVQSPAGAKLDPSLYAGLATDKDGDRSGDLTIHQLLNHQNGLKDYWDNDKFNEQFCSDPSRIWKPDEVLKFARGGDFVTEEDSDFNYTDTAYVLLGYVIETVSGKSLQDAYKDLIYDRTQPPMGQTSLAWRQPPAKSRHSHSVASLCEPMPRRTAGCHSSTTTNCRMG